ncbi:MAG: hypothetical protein EAZ55_08455 [Cytophagales bacterium]|nr:MAG: hypothetical protein EAZ55_08455 [Cytophagales bacterium]
MRKQVFIIISLVIFCMQGVNAQVAKSTADSLSDLYKRYFELNSQYNAMREEVNVGIRGIQDIQLQNLINAKSRYEKNTRSVKATATFLEGFSNSLNNLENSLNFASYFSKISALNNPNNDELGFTLEKEVLRILDEKIIKGNARFNNKKPSRFREIVSHIINNPLTEVLTSVVPGVNSILSVVNMVNQVALQDESVNTSQVIDFQKDMQKFIKHYERLAQANNDLSFNLQTLKVKTEALRKVTLDFSKGLIVNLHDNAQNPDLNTLSLEDLIEKYYSLANVTLVIDKLEGENRSGSTINYDKLLQNRLVYSSLARSKISFIGEEFERLANEYRTLMSEYHKNILLILSDAKTLSPSPEKIAKKVTEIEEEYTNLIDKYQQTVGIERLKARMNAVPIY